MEIKTEVSRKIFDTENNVVEEGSLVVFTVDKKCLYGFYAGINKKGALEFENPMNVNLKFSFMPKSITAMRIVKDAE